MSTLHLAPAPRTSTSDNPDCPLASSMTSPYWDQFTPAFIRTADVGFADEFSRLAVQKGWKTRSDIWHKERLQCYSQEFEALYGSASHLEGWAKLCAEVGETEIPVSITQAKKVRCSSRRDLDSS